MENAVDALKIAFAVMVFTIALSVAMATFSQARETSEAVLFMNDKTNYYSYDEVGEATDMGEYIQYEIQKTDGSPNIIYTDKRIVGIEAIIPTLYRYYKENYTVIFELDNAGTKLPIYYLNSIDDKWNKDYNSSVSDEKVINYFDLNSEISRNCPWVGTVNDIKKNIDLFLKGTTGITDNALKSFGNIARCVNYHRFSYNGVNNVGFIEAYKNATFLEELGEYSTNRSYGIETDNNGDKWVVISTENKKYLYNQSNGMVDADGDGTEDTKVDIFLNSKGLVIDPDASTFLDDESGEIIELAKPTIKRVIKYTLQTP